MIEDDPWQKTWRDRLLLGIPLAAWEALEAYMQAEGIQALDLGPETPEEVAEEKAMLDLAGRLGNAARATQEELALAAYRE